MKDSIGALHNMAPQAGFNQLRSRFAVLFDALEKAGCFILRNGTIEDYFINRVSVSSKPEAAAEEAFGFLNRSPAELETHYADVLRALRSAAPVLPVDENQMLREQLGAAIGAVFQTMDYSTSDGTINGRARGVIGSIMDIFSFENCSTCDEKILQVKIVSPLFQRNTFPFTISESDNQTVIIRQKLPSP